MEQKALPKLGDEHTLLSKKLLKLVVVLYNLQKGMSPNEIAEQFKVEIMAERTDEICKENRKDETSVNLNSMGSFEESSQISCPISSNHGFNLVGLNTNSACHSR